MGSTVSDIGQGVGNIIGTGATFDKGKLTAKGTGLLGWMGENPAAAGGLLAGGAGMLTGLDPYTAMSMAGQTSGDINQSISSRQKAESEQRANEAKAMLDQQKLLLDIEQAKQQSKQFSVETALKQKEAEQSIINESYDTAAKMFPKDPKAAADYAQKLMMQRTKGGNVTVGNKSFFGLMGSRPVTYTPAQQSGVANNGILNTKS